MASEHNRLFETFVQFDNTSKSLVEGFVAYGLYKKAKREWALDLFEREERAPTKEELAAYIATWTPSQIEGKQTEARQILLRFSDDIIEAEKPDIREEALRGLFWGGVWQAIVANTLYTLLLIGIVIVLAVAGIDLLGIIERVRS